MRADVKHTPKNYTWTTASIVVSPMVEGGSLTIPPFWLTVPVQSLYPMPRTSEPGESVPGGPRHG